VKSNLKKAVADWIDRTVVQSDPKLARLQEENDRLSRLLGLVQSYQAAIGTPPRWLTPKRKPHRLAATATVQLSDLHLDEVVDPAQVGGLNAYNREIAELRLRRWARRPARWATSTAMSGTGAPDLGRRHGERGDPRGAPRNECGLPPGNPHAWAPLLAAAIRMVADFYGRVHVAAIVGNHGRLTKKPQAKGRARNSWDWLLSQMVRSHLASDGRISGTSPPVPTSSSRSTTSGSTRPTATRSRAATGGPESGRRCRRSTHRDRARRRPRQADRLLGDPPLATALCKRTSKVSRATGP
jgi:hypothetical protein